MIKHTAIPVIFVLVRELEEGGCETGDDSPVLSDSEEVTLTMVDINRPPMQGDP